MPPDADPTLEFGRDYAEICKNSHEILLLPPAWPPSGVGRRASSVGQKGSVMSPAQSPHIVVAAPLHSQHTSPFLNRPWKRSSRLTPPPAHCPQGLAPVPPHVAHPAFPRARTNGCMPHMASSSPRESPPGVRVPSISAGSDDAPRPSPPAPPAAGCCGVDHTTTSTQLRLVLPSAGPGGPPPQPRDAGAL